MSDDCCPEVLQVQLNQQWTHGDDYRCPECHHSDDAEQHLLCENLRMSQGFAESHVSVKGRGQKHPRLHALESVSEIHLDQTGVKVNMF